MIRRVSLKRFVRAEDGAAFVEFGIMLPMFLLLFGLCVEGTRMFWAYQTTLTGVREATRYLSRVVDADLCRQGGGTAAWNDTLAEMITNSVSGEGLLPAAVTVTSVTSSLGCSNAGFRGGMAGVATVSAELTVNYPFSGLITQGTGKKPSLKTRISSTSRVLGL